MSGKFLMLFFSTRKVSEFYPIITTAFRKYIPLAARRSFLIAPVLLQFIRILTIFGPFHLFYRYMNQTGNDMKRNRRTWLIAGVIIAIVLLLYWLFAATTLNEAGDDPFGPPAIEEVE